MKSLASKSKAKSPKTTKAAKPTGHRHRCPVHKGDWQHPMPCNKPKTLTRICPDCEALNPHHTSNGAPMPEPTAMSQVVPEGPSPEPVAAIPSTSPEIPPPPAWLAAVSKAAPATIPALTPPKPTAKPGAYPFDKTVTTGLPGKDGALIFARAWRNRKGYVPTLVVRQGTSRVVYPVGKPRSTKAEALAEAERLQAQHIEQNTLPTARQQEEGR